VTSIKLFLTVYYVSAYAVLRATSEAHANGKIGVSELQNPWTNWHEL